MTQRLEQLIEILRALPEAQQDEYAAMIEEELHGDARWRELFARPESPRLLEQLADEALEEHRAGKTRPIEDLL